MRSTYKFFLFNKNKNPLFVDNAGHVQEGDPVTLLKPDGTLCDVNAPQGWQGILVKYARNIEFMGLFRDMTVPMSFPGYAAKILRDQMWRFGAEAVVSFGIARLDVSGLPYTYETWYVTEINFYKFVQQDDFVVTEALEGGLSKLLKSRQDNKYRMTLDTAKSFHVIRDGLTLTETANYSITEAIECKYNDLSDKFRLPANFINKDGRTSGVAWFTQNIEQVEAGFPRTSADYLAKAGNNTAPVSVHVTGRIVYRCINEGDGSISFRMRFETTAQGFADQDDYALPIQPFLNGEVYTVDVDITIPLANGVGLYLIGIFYGFGPPDNASLEFLESKLAFTYSNKVAKSYSKEMYGIDVLKAIVDKMTDGQYTAKSDWLTARKDISYTSGTSIRNNGRQGDFMETSLKDFFQDLKKYGVALGIQGDKVVIEPRSFFFRGDVIIQLGEVSGLEISVAEDLFFSKIRAGYRNIEYEDVNCIYEFNNGSNWQMPHTKNDNELNLESSYRADPIGTEIYRIETMGKDTTDNDGDKDIFISKIELVSQVVTQITDFNAAGAYMTNPGEYPFNPLSIVKITGTVSNNTNQVIAGQGINIVAFDNTVPVVDELAVNATITFVTGGIFKFNRPAYTSISGIPEPLEADIYNTELTPKKAILDNGDFIHAIADYMDALNIKFLKNDKEKAALFETILAGVTLTQGTDIQIGSLARKVFLPYYLTFKTQVELNLLTLIDIDPYGMVSGYWRGYQFFGFLMDGGVEPHTQAAQEWKLIAAIATDMRKFKANE